MSTLESTKHAVRTRRRLDLSRVAVAVDGYCEGTDAVALGAAIAKVAGADLLLATVHPHPLVVLPEELSWTTVHKEAESRLRELRDAYAPSARIAAKTDLSVARALERTVQRERCDLLVVGSSRRTHQGRVGMSARTRGFVSHLECALAVAPRGLHARAPLPLRTIGVGYDGDAEAHEALRWAASLATAAGAELVVRGVVDDRIPPIGYAAIGQGGADAPIWHDCVVATIDRLTKRLFEATAGLDVTVRREVSRGRPEDSLIDLSQDVDLLVIGSRRWGPAAHLLLGTTGVGVLHGAKCPVVAVPRPRS